MPKHFVRSLTLAGFIAIVVLAPRNAAAETTSPPDNDVPAVPANIQVPAGHSVYFKGHAIGTQNFICLATSAGIAWRFTGPQATLFITLKEDLSQQITTHFLSANPGENGLPRPTWQHSFDTSSVWGRVVAQSNDPAYVEAGAIPWLLLQVAGAQLGPTGGRVLTQTTYIHRLNTTGGLAPTTGCSDPADVGAVRLVPYTADYFFYKASK